MVVVSAARSSAGGSANTITLGTLAVAMSVPTGAGAVVVVGSAEVSGAASGASLPEQAAASISRATSTASRAIRRDGEVGPTWRMRG